MATMYIFMASYCQYNSLGFSFLEAGNCFDVIIYVDNSVISGA